MSLLSNLMGDHFLGANTVSKLLPICQSMQSVVNNKSTFWLSHGEPVQYLDGWPFC